VRSLEAVRGGRRVPILAFSADALPQDRERCLAAGCDGHLSKPVSRRALLEALEHHLAVAPQAPAAPPAEPPPPQRAPDSESLPVAPVLAEEPPEEEGIEALAEGYLARRTADVASLRALLERGDFSTIERRGHNMKGSGTTYGFPEISLIGERIEASARSKRREETATAISELETCVQSLHDARASLPMLPKAPV
jgi:HPt (histidine-containing phosphotransfer) domain-containing protein